MSNCDSSSLPGDILAPPAGAEVAAVELGYAETISLALVNDTFTFPVKNWRSVGFYLKTGTADISFDSGATYTASYDITDGHKVFGQGNINEFDPSKIILKATAINTTVQTFGDYIT